MSDDATKVLSPGPRRLGRYELVSKLGAGGMAEVYVAIDRAPGADTRPIVVKTILPHLSADPEFQQMFMAEAKLTARFDHPNLVRVLDLGRIEGTLFLAMELVDGCDLSRLLRKLEGEDRTLPLFDAIQLTVGALHGLHHAHTFPGANGEPLGVVHRDISPANVLLTRSGQAKITDFGIAKVEQEAAERTQAGVLKGKLRYMAPEQLVRGRLDARTDVYAVGMVLYMMLAGRHVYEGFGDIELIDAIRSGGFLIPSTYNPAVPPDLDRICEKACAFDPRLRFQSAEEFAQVLERYASSRLSLRTNTLAQEIVSLAPTAPGEAREDSRSDSKSSSSLHALAPEMAQALAEIAKAFPELPKPKKS